MSSSWKPIRVEQISHGHDSADRDDPPLDPARKARDQVNFVDVDGNDILQRRC
jgi:hypothetical protein